jgi:hypothetical protein
MTYSFAAYDRSALDSRLRGNDGAFVKNWHEAARK